jgi:hypothetical protein
MIAQAHALPRCQALASIDDAAARVVDLRSRARAFTVATLIAGEPTYHVRMPELVVPHAITPVFHAEPDIRAPDGAIFGWFLDPPGALIQFVKPVKGTSELASWLVGPAASELVATFPQRNDMFFVLDLTNMVGRSAAARSILLHSAKVLGARFARVFVIPPAEYPPMYLKAFHASVAFVRLLGMHVTVAGSSRAVIERYKLAPHRQG